MFEEAFKQDNLGDTPQKEHIQGFTKTDNSKKTIVLAIPHTGWIVAGLETRITQWIMEGEYNVRQIFSEIKPTYANRNHIVQEFLATDGDYLITIDSDTVPEKNVLKLADYGKDVVGGIYPTWKNGKFIWLACRLAEDGSYKQYPKDYQHGLKQVDAIGTGCMCVSRRVFESIKMPFIDKVREGIGDRELGHDLYFCKRAKELGYEVWADFDLKCEHYKELPIYEIMKKTNS